MNRRYTLLLAAGVCAAFAIVNTSLAATVWTGPSITFVKPAGASTILSNQDKLTASVILSRNTSNGMINVASPADVAAFNAASPTGTTWATNIILANAGQNITATNYAALTFDTWTIAYNTPGMSGTLNANIISHDAVVHLVADDIYLNLHFTSFQGGGSGGAFTYVRSTPVPEPAAWHLLLTGVPALIAVTLRGWRRG
jgi:hypothetical protein